MSVETELNSLKGEVKDLKDSVRDLRNIINGNGKVGIAELLRRVVGILFANPDTGSPGLAKDVEDIKRMVAQTRAIWWFVGAFVFLAQAVQFLLNLGGN